MSKISSTGGQALTAKPGAPPDTTGAAELFRAHAGFVARFLTRSGASAVDVDDLTQEVFLVAHRRGGYEEGPARPTTWLAEIAVRVLSTHRRTRRRRPEAGSDLDRLEEDRTLPDELVAARRSLERVEHCLGGLDEEHRTVFVRYELEGEPCAAIAAALELRVGTVYSRLYYARRKFLEVWNSPQ